MRAASYIAVLILGALGAFLLMTFAPEGSVLESVRKRTDFDPSLYLNLVAVLLTSVTVILTALAIGIGVVAAFTFGEIKGTARETASKAAEKRANEILSEDNVRRRIDEVAFGDIRGRHEEELETGFDPQDTGER